MDMLSTFLQAIPIAVAGAMLLAGAIMIYIRSKHVTRSEFSKMFKRIKPLTAWVLVFTLVLTGAFAVCHHLKSKQSMSAVLSLNYSEASLAQNTNGTRFNMTEILCDEVVERAIRLGAFEDVTVEELKECLSVYPYVQGDVKDKADYHISTEFIVEYHANKNTDHLDALNVILLVTTAYKEYYIEKYTDNFSLTGQWEKPDFSEMEYLDIVEYYNKSTMSVLDYLQGLADKAPSFVTSSDASFNSIAGKVYQFKETQIEQNLRSLIVQHGIVKDKQGYIDRLNYQNINTEFSMQKHVASLDVCNETIDMYSVEMTRIVLVPTRDANGKYYMGRTNVGIDEISVKATTFSNLIAESEKELMNSNLIIQKIEEADGSPSYAAQADALIGKIDMNLQALTIEAIAAGREYSDYKMNQCIAVNITDTSLFDEMKMIAVFAVFAYASAIAYELSRKFPKV